MYELWGKGFLDRLNNSHYNEGVHTIEDLFWQTYAANEVLDDPDRIEAYMGHFPHGGVSAKLLDHLGQTWRHDTFSYYDYN